jgi:hypothetical protein
MVIAFCTACTNRRWQLEETLGPNLKTLRSTGHFLALCDFNSQDDVAGLVRGHRDRLQDGTLLHFRTEEPTSFHAAVAKNTAHRLGQRRAPDVLFNLDADNFVTPETIDLVEQTFSSEPGAVLHHWSRDWRDGSFGRIALGAASWTMVGGYDESLLEMAWQDVDLLFRSRAMGLRYRIHSHEVPPPIRNTVAQKLERTPAAPGEKPRGVFALNAENFARTMTRPIRLAPDDQRRFSGTLNLDEPVVV